MWQKVSKSFAELGDLLLTFIAAVFSLVLGTGLLCGLCVVEFVKEFVKKVKNG